MGYRDRLTYMPIKMNDSRVAALPPFVIEKIKDLLYLEDKEPYDEEKNFLYAETQGCIDLPYQNVGNLIMFWIASHDRTIHWIYLGGSEAWLDPDNHYLAFQHIPVEQLPPMAERDPNTWWIISNVGKNDGVIVTRIQIVPESEMTRDFPDLDF